MESLPPSSDRLRKRPARSGIRFGYPSPCEGYFRRRRISGVFPKARYARFGVPRGFNASARRAAESGSVHEPKAHITAAGNITPSCARHITPSRARHITRHRRISWLFPKARYARFGVPRGFNLSFLCTPLGCFSFTPRFFRRRRSVLCSARGVQYSCLRVRSIRRPNCRRSARCSQIARCMPRRGC